MAGFVYFIATECGSFVKIGFTKGNPMKRLASLQTGSPHPLRLLAYFRGSIAEEMKMHRAFAPLRRHGEWFLFRMKLWDFIHYIGSSGLDGPAQASDVHNAFHDCIETSMRHPDSLFSEEDYNQSADASALK